ncbi:MAG: DUF3187 family protein [Armatimonadota bacterium]|nr:DUF3187 family protein [bacterium]MDW8321033.1 DUF3187 family protein [Armatimonadota bacterium]
MREWLAIMVVVGMFFVSVEACCDEYQPSRWRAPLLVRNAEPLNALFLQAPPVSASVLAQNKTRFQVNLDVANHLLFDRAGNNHFEQDFEVQRLTIVYARGIGRDTEWAVYIPLCARNGGFLDEAINAWHRWFGFDGGGRAGHRNYRVHERMVYGGNTLVTLDTPAFGIGDALLEGRRSLGQSGRSFWAIRAMMKLPTGNAAQSFGSGATDAGLGVICTYQSNGRLAWHGNLSMVWVGKPSHLAVSARSMLQWMLAVEYMPDTRTSFIVQIDDNRAPVLIGVPYADGARRSLTVGVVREMHSGLYTELSMTQNQLGWLARIAPDLQLHLGIKWDW